MRPPPHTLCARVFYAALKIKFYKAPSTPTTGADVYVGTRIDLAHSWYILLFWQGIRRRRSERRKKAAVWRTFRLDTAKMWHRAIYLSAANTLSTWNTGSTHRINLLKGRAWFPPPLAVCTLQPRPTVFV